MNTPADASTTGAAPTMAAVPARLPTDEAAVAVLGQLHAALLHAARQRLSDASRSIAATDLHLVWLRPSSANEALSLHAQATGGGRSLCFCEAEAHNTQGQPVARAMATVRYTLGG